MGFVAFQRCKQMNPMKFEYKKSAKHAHSSGGEGGGNTAMALKYSKFFKNNPELIEFMKVSSKNEEEEHHKVEVKHSKETIEKDKKKKKKESLLVSDKRYKGSKYIYLFSNNIE